MIDRVERARAELVDMFGSAPRPLAVDVEAMMALMLHVVQRIKKMDDELEDAASQLHLETK